MSEHDKAPDELPPPPPSPRFVATLRGIHRWDGGGHVFNKDVPITVSQRTREYLEKAAPALFDFHALETDIPQ